MKKKSFLSLLFAFNIFCAFSQFTLQGYEDVAKFKKTKMYVVLSDTDAVFNKYIKEAVTRYWTLTAYDFIPYSKLKENSKDVNKSFMVITGFTAQLGGDPLLNNTFYNNSVGHPTHGSHISVTYGTTVLAIIMGGNKLSDYRNWMAFCYGGYELQGFSSPKVISYVRLLQNTLVTVEKNKLNKLLWSEADKLYNTAEPLTDKQILFWDKDIPTQKVITAGVGREDKKFLKKSEIEDKFKGKFSIINTEELEKNVHDSSKTNLFFGTYFEGTFNVIYLYDAGGNVCFFSKMMHNYECTDWFALVLRKMDKAFISKP